MMYPNKPLATFAARAAALFLCLAPAMSQAAYSTDFSSGPGPEWAVNGGQNTNAQGILGELDGGSAVLSLLAPLATASPLGFDLLGFRTLDGSGNCCTDTFTLSLNGSAIFSGSFNMAGGGDNVVILNTVNAVVTVNAPIFSQGGTATVSIPTLNFLAGLNTLSFSYGNLQGRGDEAWGLDNVSLPGSVSAVPEASTLITMGLGLMVVGFWASRRRDFCTA
jgi:hypothetical protein